MGYKTFKQQVKQLNAYTTIFLEKDELNLTEVIVMEETRVEDYIYRAVKNIPQNYPIHATSTKGFYRESQTDTSGNYSYMAEGILDVYKKGYDTGKSGMVSLVQGRSINLANPLDTNILSGLGAGHFAAHRFDIVQNREAFLQKKNFPIYKYWLESITSYNEHLVYIIGFGPSEEEKKGKVGRLQGRIFIEKETYAILRTEFEVTPKGLKKMNGGKLYAGSWSMNKYIVNYRLVGNKWYFSDALREGLMTNGSRYTNEVLLTDINLDKSKPIPYQNRLQYSATFAMNTGSYDNDFWKDYNISPLSGTLAESVQQLANAQKAQEAFDHENMIKLQKKRDSLQLGLDLTALPTDSLNKELERLNRLQKVVAPIDYSRAKISFGLGTQFISSGIDQLSIAYLSSDDSPSTILSFENAINRRALDILTEWSLTIFLKKHLFTNIGWQGSVLSGINNTWHLGLGTEFNLTKQRPFFLRLNAGYSIGKFARKLGVAENEFGEFKVKNKKFNADNIKLFYGSRVHSFVIMGTLAIELDAHREIYVKGGVTLPFANRPLVWFKEKGQFFNKQKKLRVDGEVLQVTNNDVPFRDPLFEGSIFSITFGFAFK